MAAKRSLEAEDSDRSLRRAMDEDAPDAAEEAAREEEAARRARLPPLPQEFVLHAMRAAAKPFKRTNFEYSDVWNSLRGVARLLHNDRYIIAAGTSVLLMHEEYLTVRIVSCI